MGVAWREGELDFWPKFRARAFGYRRVFVRDVHTGVFRKARSNDETGVTHVESAARFGTQIPLEYAYAAWGKLPTPEAGNQEQLAHMRGFLGVTVQDIRQLAAQRCRALHYLETQFTHRNRTVEKVPLDLTRLDQVEIDPAQVPLHRCLEALRLPEQQAQQ